MKHKREMIIVFVLLVVAFAWVAGAEGKELRVKVRVGPGVPEAQFSTAAQFFARDTQIRLQRVYGGSCSRNRLCVFRTAYHEAFAPFESYGNYSNKSIAGVNSGHQFINALLKMMGAPSNSLPPLFSKIGFKAAFFAEENIRSMNVWDRQARRRCKRKHGRITRRCVRREVEQCGL